MFKSPSFIIICAIAALVVRREARASSLHCMTMTDSDTDPGFDLGQPVQPASAATGAYRVLARAYRPQTFSELIGQDAMVQTLGNAIKRGRLAHAFLMTGVRGVGTTSTARLIAQALNCIGPDGPGSPTIAP